MMFIIVKHLFLEYLWKKPVMKTILIATDFSGAANNAAAYGVELANMLNASVILFSAYQQVPVPASDIPVIISMEEIETNVQKQLADEARILTACHNTSVTTCCKKGTTARAILEAVKENQVDLVITGMKKSGKQFRRIVGSTVTDLIRKIQVPMIIVPEEEKFSNLANIALAYESDITPDTDTHILDALREIAERFHSKLYLVRVTNDQFTEAYEVLHDPFQLKQIMRTLNPTVEFIEGKDIPHALTKFADHFNINMLALLPHKHSLFERWFVKSTTRAMAFETSVPLLILPGTADSKTPHDDEEDIQFN
jgi:nucleotide-binding universal stress UspA family protein